ncbi:MAG: hypothetical protein AB7N76_09595 [Planctomycetota bacterium]
MQATSRWTLALLALALCDPRDRLGCPCGETPWRIYARLPGWHWRHALGGLRWRCPCGRRWAMVGHLEEGARVSLVELGGKEDLAARAVCTPVQQRLLRGDLWKERDAMAGLKTRARVVAQQVELERLRGRVPDRHLVMAGSQAVFEATAELVRLRAREEKAESLRMVLQEHGMDVSLGLPAGLRWWRRSARELVLAWDD